ncbi:MAG: glycosyltransferase [Planctomycetaceae bacterium]|jgi:glycosyltransferase involved in cell wall biosynthesis|nr:glycosyltransferase [Planctomycetaceae bacterium]
MSRKRILFVVPTLESSGVEKQLVLLACNLPREEFEVEVAVLACGGELESDLLQSGIRYHLINKQFTIDPFALCRLKRIIQQFQPDIVHTCHFVGNCYGRYAAIACKVKFIIASESCVDLSKSSCQFFLDKYFARRTNYIVANSAGVKEFYTQHGLSEDKFVVIPNATTPVDSNVVPFSRDEFLLRLGVADSTPTGDYVPVNNPKYDFDNETYLPISNDTLLRQRPYIFGLVGRLLGQSRVTDLLWVCESLRVLDLHFHAVIIGDGVEREVLLRYRDEWGLSDCVHFIGERDDVMRIMPNFDLLLNLNKYEEQSSSILDAMQFGIPVVATNILGNSEFVVDGETGVLVQDSGDDFHKLRRDFIRAILSLLEDEPRRSQMGIAAKKRVAEYFSLEKMIERYATFYSSLFK